MMLNVLKLPNQYKDTGNKQVKDDMLRQRPKSDMVHWFLVR
jgi:hypothetical protein